MNDPGFRVEGVRQEEPFRPRAAFGGYWVFEDAASAVLIRPEIAQQLSSAAAKAAPNETGGLLAGRTLRDGQGSYVLISGQVEAPEGAGQGLAFQVSPLTTDMLRQRASRQYPTADVVGWWHSHLQPSEYSVVDVATQRMWTRADSVGLLVFAHPKPWARAYLGPESRNLGSPTRTIPEAKAGAVSPGDKAAVQAPGIEGQSGRPPIVIPGPSGAPGMSESRRQRLTRSMRVIALALLILITVFVIFGLLILALGVADLSSQVKSEQRVLMGGIRSGQSRLSGQIRRAMAASTRPAVSFECSSGPPGKSAHAVVYSCAASASVKSGAFQWLLDNRPYSMGPTAMITVPDGSHQIEVILQTATGKVRGKPLRVSLAPTSGPT